MAGGLAQLVARRTLRCIGMLNLWYAGSRLTQRQYFDDLMMEKADMKFLEQTKFVTNGELEKHNTRTAWFKKG